MVDPKSFETIAVAEDSAVEKEVKHVVTATTSVVTRIDESLGELLKQFKPLLQSLTPHLTEEVRNRLWNLLVAYKKAWLRP